MINLSYLDEAEARKEALVKEKIEAERLFRRKEEEIERLMRVEMGKVFGISDEMLFKQVDGFQGKELVDSYELTKESCEQLCDDDVEEPTGYVLIPDSEAVVKNSISIYSDERPTGEDVIRKYKGAFVEFEIWKAPNGLWFGSHKFDDCHGLFCLDRVKCAFQTQEEILEYCIKGAIEGLSKKSKPDAKRLAEKLRAMLGTQSPAQSGQLELALI
jgi:hypothetical protein